MSFRDKIFSASAWLRHRVSAANTMGFGIHSPYLFNIARAILPCRDPYYAFDAIEQLRRSMLRSNETVWVEDFGTGKSGRRRVADIASRTLKPSREAQLLMRLAVMAHAREMVELGTCLGISSAYLASSDGRARLTTFEGAPEVAETARRGWQQLGLTNIRCVVGNIDKTLPDFRPEATLDLAFFDANHTHDATLRYFEQLLPYAGPKSLFIFDDIHHSSGMQKAWEEICRHPKVTASIDLYAIGIVFFDTNLEKKTYRIRL